MVIVNEIPGSKRIEDIDDITTFLIKDSVIEVEIPISGLLVKESIVVSDCSRYQLEARSSNISRFCIGAFNYPLFINLKGSNRIVVGRIADLHVYYGKIYLKNFQVMNQPWIDRHCERVQPKQPTFVTLSTEIMQVRASLINISRTGVCVFVDKSIEKDFEDSFGMELNISLRLPPKNSLCKIEAKVAQIRSMSNELTRIGLRTFPNKAEDKVLERYLSKRKREILDEVYINFNEMLNFRETKDQYF